eukprot:12827990-Alexandrium_andersonii.AAC.1
MLAYARPRRAGSSRERYLQQLAPMLCSSQRRETFSDAGRVPVQPAALALLVRRLLRRLGARCRRAGDRAELVYEGLGCLDV